MSLYKRELAFSFLHHLPKALGLGKNNFSLMRGLFLGPKTFGDSLENSFFGRSLYPLPRELET